MPINELESLLWLIFKMVTALIILRFVGDWVLLYIGKKDKLDSVERAAAPRREVLNARTMELVQPETKPVYEKESAVAPVPFTYAREDYKKLIGEILLEHGFITQDILDKAIAHQKQYGGSVTQFLLHHEYIDDKQLAQCLSAQFKVPYLPLESYHISNDLLKLIPTDIAHKHWVLPVDKQGDALTVVMIDPLDAKAVQELEDITGLKIVPFVGIISEILSSLETNYKLFVKDKSVKSPKFFVESHNYVGAERRAHIRYKTKIDVQFPLDGNYVKSHTIDVSRGGFGLYSKESVPIGTMLTIEIDLPKDVHPLPIAAVTQVVRCIPLKNGDFELGVQTLKIAKQEIAAIIKYAVESEHNDRG